MGYGLKDIPRSEYGQGFGVKATDLESGFVLPAGNIAAGTLTPSKIGLTGTNRSGGTLTAGTLVYISGRDATTGFSVLAKAAASAEATLASWVVIADIANNASGTVAKSFTLTGQNTNAATVGDYVYLDTVAGGYTLTNAPAAGSLYQRVGTVSVKSATLGMIVFNLLDWIVPQTLEKLNQALPSTGTTGTGIAPSLQISRAGLILGVRLAFAAGLAADNTNYITFVVTNQTQSLVVTAAGSGSNTTKLSTPTGTAIVAHQGYPLALTGGANSVAAANDVIELSWAITGTLGSALVAGWSLILAPN